MVGALAGGVAGVTVLVTLLLFAAVQTRSAVPVFSVVARFVGVPGNVALGFALFVLAGAVAWPLVFLGLERYLPLWPDPAVRGVGFATALWVAFVLTGRGSLQGAVLLVYAAFTLVAHLAYGFVLGAVYGRLVDPVADATGSPRAEGF